MKSRSSTRHQIAIRGAFLLATGICVLPAQAQQITTGQADENKGRGGLSIPDEIPTPEIDDNPSAVQSISDAILGRPASSDDDAVSEILPMIESVRENRIIHGNDTFGSPKPHAANNLETSPAQELRYHTAELLLRTSRMLQGLDGDDPARKQLVSRMRKEAVRLLTPSLPAKPPAAKPTPILTY